LDKVHQGGLSPQGQRLAVLARLCVGASYAAFTVAARRVKEDFGSTFDFAFKVRGAGGRRREVGVEQRHAEARNAVLALSGQRALARASYSGSARAKARTARVSVQNARVADYCAAP
jgi:hypothetical protein